MMIINNKNKKNRKNNKKTYNLMIILIYQQIKMTIYNYDIKIDDK